MREPMSRRITLPVVAPGKAEDRRPGALSSQRRMAHTRRDEHDTCCAVEGRGRDSRARAGVADDERGLPVHKRPRDDRSLDALAAVILDDETDAFAQEPACCVDGVDCMFRGPPHGRAHILMVPRERCSNRHDDLRRGSGANPGNEEQGERNLREPPEHLSRVSSLRR